MLSKMALLPSDSSLRALLRVATATTLTVTAFALLNPVLAVRLQGEGSSSSAIGFLAMLSFLSITLAVPWMPRLFAQGGVSRALRLGLLLELVSTLGYAFTTDYTLRCLCAVGGGVGAAAVWNGTEALIAHNAPAALRGRFTGLYQTALGAGLAIGPWLPSLLPFTPRGLTFVAAGLLVLAWLLCWGGAVGALRTGDGAPVAGGGLGPALRRDPGLVAVAFVAGVFEVGLSALLTAFGAQSGLSVAAATSLAGALGLGSFALQYPCGWLADRWPMRRVWGCAGGLLLLASLGFALGGFWPGARSASAFVWGGVGGALYTLSMIRVAQAGHPDTVASTAVVITGYTLGGTFGPMLSGLALDAGGVNAQVAWLGVLSLVVVGVAWRASTDNGGSAK
jgi:MFS family permease